MLKETAHQSTYIFPASMTMALLSDVYLPYICKLSSFLLLCIFAMQCISQVLLFLRNFSLTKVLFTSGWEVILFVIFGCCLVLRSSRVFEFALPCWYTITAHVLPIGSLYFPKFLRPIPSSWQKYSFAKRTAFITFMPKLNFHISSASLRNIAPGLGGYIPIL